MSKSNAPKIENLNLDRDIDSPLRPMTWSRRKAAPKGYEILTSVLHLESQVRFLTAHIGPRAILSSFLESFRPDDAPMKHSRLDCEPEIISISQIEPRQYWVLSSEY